jgi:predicted transcriptional regulator
MANHVTTIRLDEETWKLLQAASVKEDRSITTLVTRAVRKHLKLPYKDAEGHKPPKPRDGRSIKN